MKKEHTPITPDQKAAFLLARKEIEGTKIDQGEFAGFYVKEHIKGSLYRLQNESTSVYASHDKSTKTWKIWEDRTQNK